ncbi:MAG: FliA/WhiG family RNA polymerase sigma factor [Chlamydiales bacterium]|nr:FliA/WhiG family RNA polymerase sigma factor [Chlamydiales bacterium]NCF70757.1 FliA/WhiG family RNA polymerase sigma factor [Chlamydiales bacterium]
MEKEEINKKWKEYKKTNDEDLRDELITHYLFLVKQVVKRLASGFPKHVSMEDMYSTGVMGLMKAVDRFDPEMKNKFETYASFLIKGAIIDEMRALDWVPRSVHQKAALVAQAQRELQEDLDREPSDDEVAKKMELSVDDYQDLLAKVRPAVLIPLNSTEDADAENLPILERIPDQKAKTSFEIADRNEFAKLIEEAILELPEKERMVLVLYYYENLMLKEIGEVMGVSESRVSQIHAKAIMKLRGRLQSFIKDYANFL